MPAGSNPIGVMHESARLGSAPPAAGCASLNKRQRADDEPSARALPFRVTDALLLHRGLDRVLDVLDLVECDVAQVVADLLDLADIDRLDDIAGFRIDGDRAARAFP